MNRTYLIAALISLFVTGTGLGLYTYFYGAGRKAIKIEHINGLPSSQALYMRNGEGDMVPLDFTEVAAEVMNTVVHIRSTRTMGRINDTDQYPQLPDEFERFFRDSPFRDFFQPRPYDQQSPRRRGEPPLRIGQGSGVIISDDGYIVTNHHVVSDAEDLEVTLYDNRTFKATVVGMDPTTDLALIKIDAEDLPTLPFVNSDDVKVGEWVLAVGNPFNLTSTVTAGIVSAKGRNIHILREQYAVESFIQTDAAINPGNSGGALVNLQGGLIGINTAIASPTGVYSGYGFAVPSNIVSKVVEDLMQYGVVQRGILGIMIRSVDSDLRREKRLKVNEGAFVDSLMANSSAGAAGIRTGDVIVAVNATPVKSSSQLQEIISQYRPGDVVEVTVDRYGDRKTYDVTLINMAGTTEVVKREHRPILRMLGAELETLSEEDASRLGIEGGVKVTSLYAGKLRRSTNIREGFIITKVDGRSVKAVDEFVKILEKKSGGVMLEGIYEDMEGTYYYAFGMRP